MTPREKAAAVVVAGMPAEPGLRRRARPPVEHGRAAAARLARLRRPGGRDGEDLHVARALAGRVAVPERRGGASRRAGDGARRSAARASTPPSRRCSTCADGPLGSRHFARPEYGVAFARGLGRAACAKHFPGLGSTPRLDRRGARLRRPPHAGSRAVPRRDPGRRPVRDGRARDLSPVRPAPRLVRAGDVPPAAVARLRGVAITDSLGVLGSPYAPYWARLALRAGADLVLTTSARDAGGSSTRSCRSPGRASSTRSSSGCCATAALWARRHRHRDRRLDRLSCRPRAR